MKNFFFQVKGQFKVKLKNFFSCFGKHTPVPIREAVNFGVRFHIQVQSSCRRKWRICYILWQTISKSYSEGIDKIEQRFEIKFQEFLGRVDWYLTAIEQDIWGTSKETLIKNAYCWHPRPRLIQVNFQKIQRFWNTNSTVYADGIG